MFSTHSYFCAPLSALLLYVVLTIAIIFPVNAGLMYFGIHFSSLPWSYSFWQDFSWLEVSSHSILALPTLIILITKLISKILIFQTTKLEEFSKHVSSQMQLLCSKPSMKLQSLEISSKWEWNMLQLLQPPISHQLSPQYKILSMDMH